MRYVLYILITCSLFSCTTPNKENNNTFREVTDATGRRVNIPDSIQSLIALRAGALRLICYLDATGKVIAIEGNEQKRNVPYLYANPKLRELPVIGAGNLAEPELLAANDPDVIITTYLTRGEADELQHKTGIPVLVVDYGDFNSNRKNFYQSLRFLGKVLQRERRADSLIEFIQINMAELARRSKSYSSEGKSVYIGGIAYRGAHGITSTEPHYAAFSLVKANNVAGGLGEVTSSPAAWLENAFVDVEQLIAWNPDIIYLDAAGKTLWQDDLQKESLQQSLTAVKNRKLYILLPHNWYTINYENILCNAWFVGKTLNPDNFNDINIEDKSNEIYQAFLGAPIYDSMMNKFNAYTRYNDNLH